MEEKNELTNSSEDLMLNNEEDEIDHDFQNLLEDDDSDLEIDIPPIEETKKEDFKTLDDDDEDLWTF